MHPDRDVHFLVTVYQQTRIMHPTPVGNGLIIRGFGLGRITDPCPIGRLDGFRFIWPLKYWLITVGLRGDTAPSVGSLNQA